MTQTEIIVEAEHMLYEMSLMYQYVVLVPAPVQMFEGHMIRLAINKNPTWYSNLYQSYPRKLSRRRVEQALTRIVEGKRNFRIYEQLLTELIKSGE